MTMIRLSLSCFSLSARKNEKGAKRIKLSGIDTEYNCTWVLLNGYGNKKSARGKKYTETHQSQYQAEELKKAYNFQVDVKDACDTLAEKMNEVLASE